MGTTLDEALLNAEEALRDYATETEKDGRTLVAPSVLEDVSPAAGSTLVTVPLIRLSGRNVRANLTLDEGVVAFIDGEARRRRMTRTAFGVDGASHRAGWRIEPVAGTSSDGLGRQLRHPLVSCGCRGLQR